MRNSVFRHHSRWAAAAALLGVSLFGVTPARADVSSWLFVGGGGAWVKDAKKHAYPLLQLETGLGTDPSHDWIGGGLIRSDTHFGGGTDLALLARLANHGFVNGDWGAALDIGGYQRWWGPSSRGAMGALVLGGPWGLTLGLNGTAGTHGSFGASAVLGVDLARLTVYRTSGASWWQNSFPAYRPKD